MITKDLYIDKNLFLAVRKMYDIILKMPISTKRKKDSIDGYLVTALRGPDNKNLWHKYFGACVIRDIIGFNYGFSNNPIEIYHYIISSYDKLDLASGLLDRSSKHYVRHMLGAFKELDIKFHDLDQEYIRLFRRLWRGIICNDKESVKKTLICIAMFLTQHLPEDDVLDVLNTKEEEYSSYYDY